MNIHETLQQAVENNDTNTIIAIASEQTATAERAMAEVESLRLRLDDLRNGYAAFRGNAKKYLNDLLDSDDTDTLAGLDAMAPLAAHLGVDLTNEFEVEVVLTYSFTVTAPRGMDADYIRSNLDWDKNPTFSVDIDSVELSGEDGDHDDSDITITRN